MDTELVVFELQLIQAQCVLGSTRVKTWFKGRSRTDVYLATDCFEVGRLSSYREIERGAREFIPWTVKTFDRRG
jgi:hypothetical protein